MGGSHKKRVRFTRNQHKIDLAPQRLTRDKAAPMKIIFVKKILADGSPCKKCGDVTEKLESSGQMKSIDEILIADERDPDSPGMLLAKQYNVERAPFFVIERAGEEVQVYTIYMKFVKEVLDQKTSEKEELQEIIQNNSDLDFL